MARSALRPVLQQVQRLTGDRGSGEASDAELLRRFAADRDEASFRALVRRHGPMVLDVCRAVLRNPADADDAFQATFLALARGPGSIRRAASVASWLYGVAYRTALKARATTARRRAHEARGPGRADSPPDDLTWAEARHVLHEELNALAERHRAPLVLCYLQGRTQDQAAALLGLTKGTLKRRLEEGRALLRARLVRRGLGASAALVASAWPASAVPPTLMDSVVKATATVGAAVLVPVKVSTTAAVLLALVAAGAGSAVLAVRAPVEEAARQGAGSTPAKAPRTDASGDELPVGALARMGTIRLRHHPFGTLTTTFSADGKLLASCSQELRLWDPATGKLIREIRDGNRTRSYCPLALAPDGRWVAGASRDSVCLWDTATGKRLHEFPASGQALAGSPDGKLLAGAFKDGSVAVWETATGRQTVRVRERAARGVAWPTFTPDGKGLVTLSEDRVCHWNLTNGTLQNSAGITAERAGWLLSPDAQTVAVVPRDGPITLLDAATGRERVTLENDPARRSSCFAFTADGKTLAANEAGPDGDPEGTTVALRDAKTGAFVRRLDLPTRHVRLLNFSPDGRTLVTTGHDQVIGLWDATTGKPVVRPVGHTDEILSLTFTPDGRSLVSGGLDGTVRLWDTATGRQERELTGHRWRCDVVAVTPDGRAVLSGGADSGVRVQEPGGRELHHIRLDGDPDKRDRPTLHVLALAASPDGKSATTWSRNPNTGFRVFHVWDLATGKATVERRDQSNSGDIPQLSPDGRLALTPLYEERKGDPAPMPGIGGGVGGSRLVVVGVLLHDVATGREVWRMRDADGFTGPRAFTPDGRALVTGPSQETKSGDARRYVNSLRVWELATGKERLSIPCAPETYWFQRVAAAPDGRTVATARADGTIQLWDLGTGKELLNRPLTGSGEVTRLAFAPDSRSLASAHRDGTILVWDAARTAPKVAAADPDARQLEAWWADLAGEDARRAYIAVRGFGAASEPAVRFLRERVRPVEAGPADKLRQLVADLDSPEFRRREDAVKELAALGERAGPALRAALKDGVSAEQQQRIERLLRGHYAPPSSEGLRQLRAIEALEWAGTDDARTVLRSLSAGVPEARLTREASGALTRLGRRPVGP